MMTAMPDGVVPELDLGDRMLLALRHADVGTAEMADYLGVSRQSVSNWLGGRKRPKTGALRLWALKTGVSFEWLCAARDLNPQPADYWVKAA